MWRGLIVRIVALGQFEPNSESEFALGSIAIVTTAASVVALGNHIKSAQFAALGVYLAPDIDSVTTTVILALQMNNSMQGPLV